MFSSPSTQFGEGSSNNKSTLCCGSLYRCEKIGGDECDVTIVDCDLLCFRSRSADAVQVFTVGKAMFVGHL